MAEGTLTIEFLGDRHTATTDDATTFGRAADIVIDTNPTLHRVVGQFFHSDGAWWLSNLAAAAPLVVSDLHSASTLTVAPGATARLSFASSSVSFRIGAAAYRFELGLSATTPAPPSVRGSARLQPEPDTTTQPSALQLTPEQLLLVTALAEPSLRHGQPGDLPTNREVASGLGWSITKYNRKLDAVCKKLAQSGVAGLTGTQDRLARDRRQRLVEHAIYAELVTNATIALLDAYRSSTRR